MAEYLTYRAICNICNQELVGEAILNHDPKFGISQRCKITQGFERHSRLPNHETATAKVYGFDSRQIVGTFTRTRTGILFLQTTPPIRG